MYQLTYPDFAEGLYTALLDDPFYIALLKNADDKKEDLVKYMDYSMAEAAKYGVLFIPGDHNYGLSIWGKPLTAGLELQRNREKKSFLETELGAAALDGYIQIIDFMEKQAATLVAPNAWYLSIVGVRPEFQGKGLGGELIKPVLKEADALNIPTYLETFTPRTKSFYGRLGYTEAASFTEPLTNAEYSIMIRQPQA